MNVLYLSNNNPYIPQNAKWWTNCKKVEICKYNCLTLLEKNSMLNLSVLPLQNIADILDNTYDPDR